MKHCVYFRGMDLWLTENMDYRRWLYSQIEERRRKVPSYSLRSFASKVGVSPASLSQVMSGKRKLSRKMASQIAGKLCLSPLETRRLIQSTFMERFKDYSDSPAPAASAPAPGVELEMDAFRTISDWYHYAILNLIELPEAKPDAAWFARRLGISLLEAHQALQRLKRLGLVTQDGRRLKRLRQSLSTPPGVSDAAIRKYHYQNLAKAEESLDKDSVDERDFGAITLAIDPDHLPEARKLISKFRKQIASVLAGPKKKRVYTFVTQLFPVDRK